MAKKGAKGGGTIRKKTVTRSGKEYTYWEARITTGRDPGTGKQVQRSFTGKTQKEVREKMQAAAVEVNQGTYTAPQRMTMGQWLDIWQTDYMGSIKPTTAAGYRSVIAAHIRPALGAIRLVEIHPHILQQFINGLTSLSVSTTYLVYRVLYTILQKAVDLDYISKNPACRCSPPKVEREEIHPLTDQEVSDLLVASKGTLVEQIISVDMFTGLRLSEILGLTWDAVDFKKGTITINKQLVRPHHRKDGALFQSPKSGKPRTITPAPAVMATLKQQRSRQSEMQLKAGALWSNPEHLVFTDEIGAPLNHARVTRHFKVICSSAGMEKVRFHDMRHTYAVNAIRAGDDIKTIQGNLGHATAAFTLDRYGHFTERMKQDSAARMENFMKGVLNL